MKDSKIAWTTHTFNPWVGCQRVSPGCQHCYAEAFDKRVGGATISETSAGVTMTHKALRWGPTAPRTRTSTAYWRQPLAWDKAAAKAGTRARVFCASLADVFEDRHELGAWRLELLDLIASTPHLDWLLLTKRPGDVRRLLSGAVDFWRSMPGCTEGMELAQRWVNGAAPSNVWLGTTVEDQQRADERIPALLDVPARVRFLSCEPLLEPVDLSAFVGGPYVGLPGDVVHENYNAGIDWLIIGGESGPKARPFDVAWARSLIQQGRAGGAKVFVKQLGSNVRTRNDDHLISDYSEGGWFLDPERVEENVNGYREDHQGAEVRVRLVARAGEDPAEWPEDLRVREFPEVRP